MSEPPDKPAAPSTAGGKPRRFPWAILIVPILIAIAVYVSTLNLGANLDEATLRRKAEDYIVSALPGRERARVTVDSVEKDQNSANVAGTAEETDFSGNKRRHNWHMTFYITAGEYKATDWKITPQ
jgi:hypothetical protein